MSLLLLAPALFAALPAPTAAGIAWEPSFDAAMTRAQAERRVVFLAVNMDGERANDTLAKEVYAAKRIRELAEHTVPLVASLSDHGGARACPRFGAVSCDQHREVDARARQDVLKPDADGWVVAPQHVFLDPEGQVLLSVPYEVSEAELEWCFVAAITRLDPAFEWRLTAGAKAPKRLILGGVYELGANGIGKPLTREQVLERIAEVKKGTMSWEERFTALREILSTDEPEALDFIRTELRAARGGGRFGGGGRGGGAGDGQGGRDPRGRILHQIGVFSPRSYWEVAVEWAEGGEVGPQTEAIVALEQLGAPEALKTIETALRKEKDPALQKLLLRALGSVGAADKGARSKLVKAATKEKDPVLRRNAIVALGSLAPDEEVRAALTELAAVGPDAPARIAAACAMGISRDASWKELLEATRKQAEEAQLPELVEACAAALQVLAGGNLAPLRAPVRAVCEDTIERQRLFGFAVE